MGQALILAEVNFDDAHVTAVNDSGTETEYGREARAAEPSDDNVGKLAPVPMGYPDGAVNVDVIVRAAGNADSARVGWQDHGAGLWKGKTAAHIPQDVQFLKYGGIAGNDMLGRAKALPLANGDLLVFHVRSVTAGSYLSSAINVYLGSAYDNGSALFATAVALPLGSTSAMSALVTVDAVQFPDTGEVLVIAGGYDSSNNLILQRFTGAPTAEGTIPAFVASPIEYTDLGPLSNHAGNTVPTSFAIEVLNTGRVAMLLHYFGGFCGTARSYSDDRGASWAAFLDFTANTEGTGHTAQILGGVDIKRLRNGSLLALVGVTAAGIGTGTGIEFRNESVVPYVSDDGDTWVGLLSHNINDGGSTYFTPYDWPIGVDGMIEAALAVGDDGYPHVFGCLHGNSAATYLDGTSAHATSYYDDLVQLALKKVDISTKDKGATYPVGAAPGSSFTPITTSDAFDNPTDPATGFPSVYTGQPQGVTGWRCMATAGAGTGNLIGGSATYKGPRYVEAVSWRGAIWLFVTCWNNAGATTALGAIRCNAWSELNERPGNATDLTHILYGGVYRQGWMAGAKPADQGITKNGAGVETLEGLSGVGGLKLDTTGGAGATYYDLGTLEGTTTSGGFPTFVRWKCKAVSGAGVAAADVAVRLHMFSTTPNPDQEIDVYVYLSATQIRVYDNVAAAFVGTAETFTSGAVEVVLAMSNYNTALGLFYKPIGNALKNPEDAVWHQYAGLPSGTTFANQDATGSEALEWGTFSSNNVVSAWHNVQFTRGSDASRIPMARLFSGAYAFDAATPDLSEFVSDKIGYDDGLTHGTRAPRANSQPMYLRNNERVAWRGASASEQDQWQVQNGYVFDSAKVRTVPVREYWRSADDDANINLLWDTGANGPLYQPTYFALFGLNAYQFRFQMNATNSWGSPSVDLLVDASGAANRWRHEYKRSSGFAIEQNGYQVRLTGDVTPNLPPLEPHRFRSTDKLTWYLWDDTNGTASRIADNDGYRLFMTDPVAGSATSGFIAIYPDVFAAYVSVASGYRYIRLHFPAGQILPETFFKLGFAVVGQAYDLTAPHPNWSWQRRRIPFISRTETEAGFSFVSKIGEAREEYTLAFTGMRGRKDRASASAAPVDQPGYERLISVVERLDWGGELGAFLTGYSNQIDGSNAGSFGNRTFEVFPARISSPIDLSHQAYEGCRSDGLVMPIHDLASLLVEEVL